MPALDPAVESVIRKLSVIASPDSTSEQTGVIAQAKAFREWLDEPKPVFDAKGEDKFAGLIGLTRSYPYAAEYFVNEVDVQATTVWRWGTGKCKPGHFVGTRMSAELQARVAEHIIGMARCAGLDPDGVPPQPAPDTRTPLEILHARIRENYPGIHANLGNASGDTATMDILRPDGIGRLIVEWRRDGGFTVCRIDGSSYYGLSEAEESRAGDTPDEAMTVLLEFIGDAMAV